ncbi:hypothetical protein JW824_06130, partial [bacterium]|nr:hypothetical protein [bacterium]
QKHVIGMVRFEQFQHQNQSLSYQRISQASFRYQESGLDIQVGNFYSIIGRGLLLRSYEIPAMVYEDAGFRVRYGFYRDIEGVKFEYRNPYFRLKTLRGRPLINGLPPTSRRQDRRLDLVEAVEVETDLKRVQIGAAFLRNHHTDQIHDYVSGMFDIQLPLQLALYVEMAREIQPTQSWFETNSQSAYGVYNSLNWTVGPLGMSVEYKNYSRFFLGSGFNDPPPLVKEHSYPVLNRVTHVLNLNDEKGFQADLFYRLPAGHLITANYSSAQNQTLVKTFRFQELFGEWWAPLSDRTQMKLFTDFAYDELQGEKNRFSIGIVWDQQWERQWSTILDLEYQTFRNNFYPARRFSNTVARWSIARSPKASFSIIFETSSDPKLTDQPNTFDVETSTRTWLGTALGYNPTSRHSIQVFYGERRGGPACTSGICYEMLDFKGFEFRLTSRF